ncbi:HlyD family efflux transporter periplasmic adaptor subunit [Chitinimonas arctica]|uniref:HlyD family efflux transporter periplasmic adaptor subunit n=1 Tax=Chitinimonas arctica TaxID=2594795 RepID=A0A516SMK0_9NEIS|nr:HlyD family efflux transporter periplasmic adaptor subunit [Chitinimonas arctica]
MHAGPPQADGSPSWMLHDPAANRFYQLGWPAFEILRHWALGWAEPVIERVNGSTTLNIDSEEVAAVSDFLARHNLLLADRPEHTDRLVRQARASKLSHAMWLLKHYLFFRVPLLQPMPLLRRLAPAFEWVCRPRFWWLLAGLAMLGLWLVSRRWDEFTHTFSAYGGMEGVLGIVVSLSIAKVAHEFGHALTAQRFGCRVPTMGVAFLVMMPVLYTDTNEAWKLPSRRQRMLIGAAGMLAELCLAVLATLAWSFLPDGPIRAGAFMLATTTWLATLAINASPFMRFDGYFLLADWMNLPNLHSRAFAMGRCWLRRRLLGLDEPWPEHFAAGRRRFLIAFACATWLYRLVIFLSIAFLVYHLFFKALGLLLLVVELGWFIALPLWSELSVWWRRRAELRWNLQTVRSVLFLAGALLFVALPWRTEVSAPAIMGARDAQTLYAPAPAEVLAVASREGEWVAAGQLLLSLRSPELEAELALAERRAATLRWQMDQQPFHPELLAQGLALGKQWQGAEEKVAGLRRQQAQLAVRAPFAGRVVDASLALRPGTMIPAGERLLGLVGAQGVKGEAFVDEGNLARLRAHSEAVFIADQTEQAAIHCHLGGIDRLTLASLDQPALASSYGGPIATQRVGQTLVPLAATFRVRLMQCEAGAAPLREMTGVAKLRGERSSLLGRGVDGLLAVLHGEAAL